MMEDDGEGYQKARDAVLEFAKTSHRAEDMGLINRGEGET